MAFKGQRYGLIISRLIRRPNVDSAVIGHGSDLNAVTTPSAVGEPSRIGQIRLSQHFLVNKISGCKINLATNIQRDQDAFP